MLEKRLNRLGLGEVYEKVCTDSRLTLEEGEALYQCRDLHAVLGLANLARRLRHGVKTHYVLNRHINYTNVCVQRCTFCAFRRAEDERGAFTLEHEDVYARLQTPEAKGVAEVHIVGGCHPFLPLRWYEELVAGVRERFPDVVIKGFTMVEIAHFADLERVDTREVLRRLQAAGLAMLPGGGAEIFAPEVRKRVCPTKISGEEWLRIAGEAHSLGLKSNCTMLFGHVESLEHRLLHLDALRRQQDLSRGFMCFIPLPFLTQNNQLAQSDGFTPMDARGQDMLRTVAISRLLLDNVPHIKAYWVMLGLKTALTALHCGADDIDGTIFEEHIGHMAGAESEQALSCEALDAALRKSGLEPHRRDGLYRPLPATGGDEAEEPVTPRPRTCGPSCATLLAKAAEGRRLHFEEALQLYEKAPLHELGAAAHAVRMDKCPTAVATYVVDRNINYTNVCVCGCRFCAFYATPENNGAGRKGYVMEQAELGRKIEETLALGGRQILLQGGCHPDLRLSFYEGMLRFIRENYPQIHIHGFSPPEIFHIAQIEGLETAVVIDRLRRAGLHSIPGGGAEILVNRVRNKVSPGKCPVDAWLDVMRQAHLQGMRTTATMMFGHEETVAERLQHIFTIRALQDETGGFTAFIPWTFQPDNTAIRCFPEPPSVYLRVLALSRLVLDNVDNIQASWVTMGPQVAQTALCYGANDFGSTMIEENVVAAAGVRFMLEEDSLRRIVRLAGFSPCRRSMDYTLLEEVARV